MEQHYPKRGRQVVRWAQQQLKHRYSRSLLEQVEWTYRDSLSNDWMQQQSASFRLKWQSIPSIELYGNSKLFDNEQNDDWFPFWGNVWLHRSSRVSKASEQLQAAPKDLFERNKRDQTPKRTIKRCNLLN